MSRSDLERIELAIEHLDVLSRHLGQGTLNESLVLDAVCMRLSAAIDEADRIEQRLLLKEFGAEWRNIVDQRNFIAHGYAFIDANIMTTAIDRDVPRLAHGLQNIRDRIDT